jgi:AcrR family transcriptional regulator
VPRAGLNPQRVVEEAARLADEVGFDGVTLAALAERFGVAYPSLYKHVGGLADVRERLGALALRELGDALATAAVGRSGGDALRGMADAYRRYASEHPGCYQATLGAPSEDQVERSQAAAALLGTVFAVLAGYGLSGDDAVDATRAVHSALHGFVSLQSAGAFGMPQDVDRSFARLVASLDAALANWTYVASSS